MIKIFKSLLYIAIVSLLLVSCSPDKSTTTTSSSIPTTTKPASTTSAPTSPPSSDKPQYGGMIVVAGTTPWQDYDEVKGSPITYNHTMRFTSQELWIGDWSTGPAGTNENKLGDSRPMTFKTGDLAESWEFDEWDAGKLVFKIRKGCHFALNPKSAASQLVKGREVTAEDVVFSLKQVSTTSSAYIYNATPVLRTAEMTAPDKYTFTIKADPPAATWFLRITDFVHIVPHEVVEKYGDMRDWRNSVGSGPWMLVDLVDNSSTTFDKNPTYWMTDTGNAGKGNQLPYADTVRFLVVPDMSTMQSAFRTGRIDTFQANWEDAPGLIDSLPDIKSAKTQNSSGNLMGAVAMRTDKTPFNDIRFRKALFKALDFPTISTAITGPGSTYQGFPLGYFDAYKDAYLSLDDPDCPPEVTDVYTYDPAAAKKLLEEAGYPDGISFPAIVLGSVEVLDYWQVLQSYWAEVGINITIDAREQGAWYALLQKRNYEYMMWSSFAPAAQIHQCTSMWGESANNCSYVNDPIVVAAREKMMPLDVIDDPAADAIHRELMKYVLAQCWVIPTPAGPTYGLWWPWLKQYWGFRSGWGYINTDNWVTWAWVDQSLKKSMGH